MGIIEIRDLSLTLNGVQILKNVSLDIWDGHIHALVGTNGAGKSTLASTIMGLEGYREVTGDILFRGENINTLSIDERARKGITFGWQEPARFEGVSIFDFVSAGISSGKQDDKETITKDALIQLGLQPEEYLYRSVDQTLSGGERKKIELASIIAMDPPFIMLDEPDSGIDVGTLEKMNEVIKKLKRNGTTILLITHSLAVLRQADHAFLMCDGQIIEKAAASKIIPYFEKNCIPCSHKNMPNKVGAL
ncbi:MAG: ABC transporter ATP-binding protein [Candidatus Thermoplasmatota archaeon]|nr:ABC transporter ATP-binding protein [Candidatus Thermoplasmatota archaeon]